MKNSESQRVWLARKSAWRLIRIPSNGLSQMLKRAMEENRLLDVLDTVVKLNNIFVNFPDLIEKEGENPRQKAMVTNIYEMELRLYQLSQRILARKSSVDVTDAVPAEFRKELHSRLLYTIFKSTNVIGHILENFLSKNQKAQFVQWRKFGQEYLSTHPVVEIPDDSALEVIQELKIDWSLHVNIQREVCTGDCAYTKKAYYCIRCEKANVPLPPPLSLPFHLHVVIDQNYSKKKSTGFHAKILSDPSQVSVYRGLDDFPALPLYSTIVLFPTASAVTIAQIAASSPPAAASTTCPVTSVKHVVVLEATWQGAQGLVAHPALRGYTFAKLDEALDRKTIFWRHQSFGGGCLSTIECIHQVCLDFEANFGRSFAGVERGERGVPNYDSLLFFFVLGYKRIKEFYSSKEDLIKPTYW